MCVGICLCGRYAHMCNGCMCTYVSIYVEAISQPQLLFIRQCLLVD